MQSLLQRFDISNFGDFIRKWHQLSGSKKPIDMSPVSFFMDTKLNEYVPYSKFKAAFYGEAIPSQELVEAVQKVFPIGDALNKAFFSHQMLDELEGHFAQERAIEESQHPLRKKFFSELLNYTASHDEHIFGKFLHCFLNAVQTSQEGFAESVGINQATFNQWVSGHRLPSQENFETLVSALELEGNAKIVMARMCGQEIIKPQLGDLLDDYIAEEGKDFRSFIKLVCRRWQISIPRLAELGGVIPSTVYSWLHSTEHPRSENIQTFSANFSLTKEQTSHLIKLANGKLDARTFEDCLKEYTKQTLETEKTFSGFLEYYFEYGITTKTEFAAQLGITLETVSNWINRGEKPKLKMQSYIIDTFGLDNSIAEMLRDLIKPKQQYQTLPSVLEEYVATGGHGFIGLIKVINETWKVSQAEMAQRLGLSMQVIGTWLRGEALAREDVIPEKIARAMNLSEAQIACLNTLIRNDRSQDLSAASRINQASGACQGR